MGNKIKELYDLYNQTINTETKITEIIESLKRVSENFVFKFNYNTPGDHGVEIITKDGTNELKLSSSDTFELYEFLKNILEEPKQNIEKPITKSKKEDIKV